MKLKLAATFEKLRTLVLRTQKQIGSSDPEEYWRNAQWNPACQAGCAFHLSPAPHRRSRKATYVLDRRSSRIPLGRQKSRDKYEAQRLDRNRLEVAFRGPKKIADRMAANDLQRVGHGPALSDAYDVRFE